MATCYVYIIECNTGNESPIKIGVSENPESRINELQTGNPYPLKLSSKIPMPSRKAAEDLELYLHNRLSYHRMNGEWFSTKKLGGRLKGALRDYDPERRVLSRREKVKHKQVFGSKSDRTIQDLKNENRKLKKRVQELEEEVEQALDMNLLYK